MEQYKIDRINALARLAKERPLTNAEADERHALRQEYLDEWRRSTIATLENTYIDDGSGNLRKLKKKE
ncbi:MAG: DUF896 domain-containing protein [Candidatus Heteroscillospira sp.]|jgi:uncharacterized protein YnzC (UPF0291/DUF896 family)